MATLSQACYEMTRGIDVYVVLDLSPEDIKFFGVSEEHIKRFGGTLFQECIGCIDVIEALHTVFDSGFYKPGKYVLMRGDTEVLTFNK